MTVTLGVFPSGRLQAQQQSLAEEQEAVNRTLEAAAASISEAEVAPAQVDALAQVSAGTMGWRCQSFESHLQSSESAAVLLQSAGSLLS